MDRVLVDTSVWIEFFRKHDPYYRAVLGLMDEGRICCIGIVLAELLQGAKSEKELSILRDFLHVFDFLPENAVLWEKAGELSYRMRKAGKSIGLADCFIAVAANEADVALFTTDSHFEQMKKEAGVKLFMPA